MTFGVALMIFGVLLWISSWSGSTKLSTEEERTSADRFIENLRRIEAETERLRKERGDILNPS